MYCFFFMLNWEFVFFFLIVTADMSFRVYLKWVALCKQLNPENTVGVMTMAGKGVRVLVTPTSDLGKILACMHG